MKRIWLVPLLVVGCAGPDIIIRNPLVAGGVDANRIVRTHGFIEATRRLPPGSVADEAQLLSLDGKQACFAVVMHELLPIDLRDIDATLKAPKSGAESAAAQVWPEPTTFRTYMGLVPEQRETGVTSTCVARDAYGNCTEWRSTPIYSTVMVPGPVNVYEARGRLCVANGTVVLPTTELVALHLRLRKEGSFGSKRSEFRWGFPTATAGPAKPQG